MTRTLNRRLFAFSLAALLCVVFARGENSKPCLGSWSMTSETDGDPVLWTLTVKDTDGKLTATAMVGEDAQPVKDLSYADGLLTGTLPGSCV